MPGSLMTPKTTSQGVWQQRKSKRVKSTTSTMMAVCLLNLSVNNTFASEPKHTQDVTDFTGCDLQGQLRLPMFLLCFDSSR